MPTSRATRSAVSRRVAGQQHRRQAERLQLADRLGARRLDRVAHGERRPRHAVPATTSMRPSRRPTATSWPSTTPVTPTPGWLRKPATGGSSPSSARAARATACAIGCSVAASTAPASRSTSAREAPFSERDLGELHPALGDGAGLVEHDRVDAARLLEDLRPLDQDAELRAAAGADHQRRRRRQPERAGAGDDQHGDGGGERRRGRGAEREPAGERQQREHDHDRHEDRGDAVGEPLHRRLAGLRRVDQARDLRERGVGADPRRAHDEPAVAC